MKTLKELVEEQENIENSIYELASSKGLSSSDLLPITDGVACPEQYLNAKYQIMCILKEPYDGISEEGVTSGGGWSIVNECFKGYGPDGLEPKDDIWRQSTWQPLIYFLYALFHGMHWQDLNWLRDQPEMAKVLQDIAYLNVNKMPAFTTSYYKAMEEHYETWKPILHRQIKLYDPSVIVFHGTFNLFAEDISSVLGAPLEVIRELEIDGVYYGAAYRCGEKLLIAVDHPLCHKAGFCRGNYVDILIDTIKELARE